MKIEKHNIKSQINLFVNKFYLIKFLYKFIREIRKRRSINSIHRSSRQRYTNQYSRQSQTCGIFFETKWNR